MHARIGWQNLRTSEFLDSGEYMLITGTDFQDGKIDYSKVHYVEKERYEQDKKIQISNGSILITKDGTIGKVAYVENLPMKSTLNAGVFNLTVVDDINTSSLYLYHYLKGPFLLRFVNEESTGGTIKHLNQNVLVKFPIPLPSYREQLKISSFLTNIDKLITLHQCKLDKLINIKKSMLEKMFVEKNTDVPEIRFKGFTDTWEQRKFIDIVERLNKTEDNVKLPRIEFEDIVSGEGRLNKDLNTKKDDRKGIFFDENNILYGKLRPYLRKWYYARFAGVAIGDFWVLKIINNNHPLFIYYLIQTEKYQRVANDTSGTKMPRSDWKKVSESLFYIPNINEQKKISTIFNIIDNLITLHQRK